MGVCSSSVPGRKPLAVAGVMSRHLHQLPQPPHPRTPHWCTAALQTLEKTYFMAADDDGVLERAEGTKVEWEAGECDGGAGGLGARAAAGTLQFHGRGRMEGGGHHPLTTSTFAPGSNSNSCSGARAYRKRPYRRPARPYRTHAYRACTACTACTAAAGKDVTVKVMKKKPKKGGKSDNKPQMKTEKIESFFNFFDPPQVI